MLQRLKIKKRQTLIIALLFVVLAAGSFVGVRTINEYNKSNEPADSAGLFESGVLEKDIPKKVTADKPKPSAATGTTKPAPPPPPPVVKPPAQAAKTVNKTNCLPPDANQYQKYSIHLTNMQYLATNSYGETNKFHDAIIFAGLEDEVNQPKTVVFTVTDWVFENKLSSEQLSYLNANPANMRAFLKWHIIPSCFIYDDYARDLKSSVTIATLAGNVTYKPGSPGYFGPAKLAIWDWFTSNGAVHFLTDFVKPPTI